MATTNITFDQHGNMKIEANGYVGSACAETTAKLLAGMGTKGQSETKKPEYYQRVQDRGRANIGR
jgi:hypothetical protein